MSLFWPWALGFGLLALPVTVGIYFLRQRSRRQAVPSLLLWSRQRAHHPRGRRVEQLKAPWLLALELLILALLALAAAGPIGEQAREERPLVVVLDDSYSMTAGEPSPRERARRALLEELSGRARHGQVTLILAADAPRILARQVAVDSVAQRLEGWRCGAAAADLEGALERAHQVADEGARFLVLTDRAPPTPPATHDLRWWSYGEPLDNTALVGAVRGGSGADSRLLVEVAHFGEGPAETSLRVESVDPAGVEEATTLASETLQLEPGVTSRLRFQVPETAELRVRLADDALVLDDQVLLPPTPRPPVRVALEVRSEPLRQALERVLLASGKARLGVGDPELVVRDRPATTNSTATTSPPGDAWVLEVVSSEPAAAYLGPFVLDHDHPLTQGLDLSGVLWAAGQGTAGLAASIGPEDRVVVRVGDRPLLVDRSPAPGQHQLRLDWRLDLSTLDRSGDWPALWWNLLDWRARERPGIQPAATRLGVPSRLVRAVVANEAVESGLVVWTTPGGEAHRFEQAPRELELAAEQVGLHTLTDGGRSFRFAVNALAPGESNLAGSASGTWGRWDDLEGAQVWQRRPMSWLPILLALVLLLLHLRWSLPGDAESSLPALGGGLR